MGKYVNYWYKTEGINRIKTKLVKTKLCMFVYRYINKNYGYEEMKKIFEKSRDNIVKDFVLGVHLLNPNVQNWVRDNILTILDRESILGVFIECLNNSNTKNNKKMIDIYIKSIKILGLVKDVEYMDDYFILTTLDDEQIKFSNVFKNVEGINKVAGRCHNLSYRYMNKHKDKGNVYSVTIIEPDFYGQGMYHSFIVRDDFVIDYTRNIFMKFSDYKKILKPNIILYIEANDFFDKLNELNNNEKFKNDNTADVLKYALHCKMGK